MAILILGLVLFLGTHSTRILLEEWRGAMVARLGLDRWKGIYSAVSIAGFVLLVWGYRLARPAAVSLWLPPVWTAHLAALLTLPAFVLLAATYVPRNQIQAALHHPMVLGVHEATERIPDGVRIAVDGVAGVVRWMPQNP